MAEAISYADLRFVKAPLRKDISKLGQDTNEDGELSYNVQVLESLEAPTSLVLPPIPGDQGGHDHSSCLKYFLLGLLLMCLLVKVAAMCLGMHYLQVSQQFGQISMLLETKNSSLEEQLHLGTTQMRQMEKNLQDSKEQLAQSQRALEEEQRAHQAAEEQLQLYQANRTKMQENLLAVQQKLSHLQDTVRPFFTCPSQDTCCAVGWIPTWRRCFHISITKRNWQENQEYCKSLSSNLAKFRDSSWGRFYHERYAWNSLLSQLSKDASFWVGLSYNKGWRWSDGTPFHGLSRGSSNCAMLEYSRFWSLKTQACSTPLPCICEMASFRFPEGNHSLQNPGV